MARARARAWRVSANPLQESARYIIIDLARARGGFTLCVLYPHRRLSTLPDANTLYL